MLPSGGTGNAADDAKLAFVERDTPAAAAATARPPSSSSPTLPAPPQPPPAYVHAGAGADDGGGVDGGTPARGLLATCTHIVNSDEPALVKARMLVYAGRQHVQQQFASLRPWSEFFDRTYMAAPAGVTESVQRLTRNVGYFYPNYIVLSLACSSYVLLINLAFSLCVIADVLLYFYIRTLSATAAASGDGQVRVCGRVYTTTQLYVLLGLFAAVSFYLTNGSSVLFWLTVTSCGVTATHAILRRPTIAESTYAFA